MHADLCPRGQRSRGGEFLGVRGVTAAASAARASPGGRSRLCATGGLISVRFVEWYRLKRLRGRCGARSSGARSSVEQGMGATEQPSSLSRRLVHCRCSTRLLEHLAWWRGRAAAGAAARVAAGAAVWACSAVCSAGLLRGDLCVADRSHCDHLVWAVVVTQRLANAYELDADDAVSRKPLLCAPLLHPPARCVVSRLAKRGVRRWCLAEWQDGAPIVCWVGGGAVGGLVLHPHDASTVDGSGGCPHLWGWDGHRGLGVCVDRVSESAGRCVAPTQCVSLHCIYIIAKLTSFQFYFVTHYRFLLGTISSEYENLFRRLRPVPVVPVAVSFSGEVVVRSCTCFFTTSTAGSLHSQSASVLLCWL